MNTPIWLEELLSNERITDICLNGPDQTYVDQGQGMEGAPGNWESGDQLRSWLIDQLSLAGKSWDAKNPFVDATIRGTHRLHAAFPPIYSAGILISLRRLPIAQTQSAAGRWTEDAAYPILREAVQRGDSVLISGATGSGKTTLANDLLSQVPTHERILALEDTPELRPHHPHFLSLVSRPPNSDGFGEVTLRNLLKQALRMRPDRIILGECRGPEVMDLLQALNTGHRGTLATLHASSAREALKRLELLCLLASGGSLPLPALRELIAMGLGWVAQMQRQGARRVISELWRIEGREGDTILLRPVVQPGYCDRDRFVETSALSHLDASDGRASRAGSAHRVLFPG